jgi:hypothetical protein
MLFLSEFKKITQTIQTGSKLLRAWALAGGIFAQMDSIDVESCSTFRKMYRCYCMAIIGQEMCCGMMVRLLP